MSDSEQSLHAAPRSRTKKWLRRVFKSGALGTELARLINKSALVGTVRWIIDTFSHRWRKTRLAVYPSVGTPEEREMHEHLQRHGWARVPDDIGADLRREISNECAVLQRSYQELNVREKDRHKTIWNYLTDIKYAGNKPNENDPLVRYALSTPILNVVGNYLGETPWLRYIILTESVFQPGEITYSQKWHLDFDDARMLKLFVYLSDVSSSGDGPFRMIGREASRRVRNSFIRRHLADDEVFDCVGSEDVIDVYGPCLSSFVVDTARVYHCGSRMAPGHSRLLYTALYTAFPSIYPKQTVDNFSVGATAPALVRKVLAPVAYTRSVAE